MHVHTHTHIGIPIDMVGGTSIGAFMGALYCEEREAEKVEKRSKPWANGMSRYLDKIFDLTYPSTSYFTGTSSLLINAHLCNRQV